MAIRVIDFETYYDSDYSLSKMQTDEYIYDPRFRIILVAVDGSAFDGTVDEIREWLLTVTNPDEDTYVAHNAFFDGFILSQILGIKPKRWIDTLGMARAALPHLKSHSLAALAQHYGFPPKRYQILQSAKGVRHFTAEALSTLATYCLHDVWLTRQIFDQLIHHINDTELDIIDMTVRMFTEPKIKLDTRLLQQSYDTELERKNKLLEACTADKDSLMSNPKLAEILKGLGVDPPMKTSARTGNKTFAFAKSDKAFTALLEDPNPEVQAVVAARLGVKSTIAETRALRMLKTSERGDGLFPVMLNYWGAKVTGRFAGSNGVNPQNFPARGVGSEIRKALIAPPGKMIVVGDSSNIELRVAMVCAKQNDAVRKLIEGVDLYCDFASLIYERPITKADKEERFLGKVAMLSLQYGVGAVKFQDTVRLLMKKEIDIKEAYRIVELYRDTYDKIVALWGHCNKTVLPAIFNGETVAVDQHGWFTTDANGFHHADDPGVRYDGLQKDPETGGWAYAKGKLYGGKVVENLCQHMARLVVMWQTAAVNKLFPVALSVHDEVVCVVDEKDVDQCISTMQGFLSHGPDWCRKYLPLAAEVHVAGNYGDAK